MHKALLTAATVLLASVQTIVPMPAEAAIYKCIDASGGTSYSSAPCPVSETTSKVLKTTGKTSNSADCRIANNFAMDVATKMREGRSSDDTFMEYGGINALPPTSISIINYVYTHRLNLSTVPARIAQLSAARCESSAYGNPTCDQFPMPYINNAGGCNAASGGAGTVSATAEQMEGDAGDVEEERSVRSSTGSSATGSLSALRVAPAVASSQNGMTPAQCRKHFEAKMNSIRDGMRARLSADQQNKLREDYRALRTQKSSC